MCGALTSLVMHVWTCARARVRPSGRLASRLRAALWGGIILRQPEVSSADAVVLGGSSMPASSWRALQCRRWCGSRVEMCGVSPAARRFNSFMVAPSSLTRHPSWWCSGVSSPACQERARSWSLACQERALACASMSVNTCSHVQRTCSSRGRPLKLRADGVRHRALRNLGRIAVGHVTILD